MQNSNNDNGQPSASGNNQLALQNNQLTVSSYIRQIKKRINSLFARLLTCKYKSK